MAYGFDEAKGFIEWYLAMENAFIELREAESLHIIETQAPRCLFWHMDKNGAFVGIDNRTGDAWGGFWRYGCDDALA